MSAVLTLCPFSIDPDEAGRIGLFFPAKAEALGVLMKAQGQTVPIAVVKAAKGSKFEWGLVFGRHRLAGAVSAGIDIKAIEVEGDELALQAMQASENVDRRELEPLERALFVREVASAAQLRVMKAHGVQSQQALAGKARQNKVQYSEVEKADEVAESARVNLTRAYGWRDETAEALGLDLNALKRSMRIHRCIIEPFPELIDGFKDHPVAKVADSLLKICAIRDEAKRREVIEKLIKTNASFGDALFLAGVTDAKAETPVYQKFSSQILGGWGRLGTADKRRFIPELAAAIPPGMRGLLREALDQLDGSPSTGTGPDPLTHYQDLAAQAARTSTGSALGGEEKA